MYINKCDLHTNNTTIFLNFSFDSLLIDTLLISILIFNNVIIIKLRTIYFILVSVQVNIVIKLKKKNPISLEFWKIKELQSCKYNLFCMTEKIALFSILWKSLSKTKVSANSDNVSFFFSYLLHVSLHVLNKTVFRGIK